MDYIQALSKPIVTSVFLGSAFQCKSKPPKGNCFSLSLPSKQGEDF